MWVCRDSAFHAEYRLDCTHAHFTCCNTTNPICSPARTSLITGRYPRQIGTLTMAGDLFPQIPTFMQALQGEDTRPTASASSIIIRPIRGLRREAAAWIRWQENRTRSLTVMISSGRPQAKQQVVSNYCFYGDYLAKKGILSRYETFFAERRQNGDVANHNYDKALPWPFDEEDYIDVVTGCVAREQLRAHPAEQPFY